MYDLVLLDLGNVKQKFGNDQELSLLRILKKMNSALVVLAYTYRALASDQADFYRLADGVLPKDASIEDTMEQVERYLRKAQNLENLWKGFLSVASVVPSSSEDRKLQDLLVL